jgi:hypothetical protein
MLTLFVRKEGNMTAWLYQISPKLWTTQRYRLEVWEGEKWAWSVGKKSLNKIHIVVGDTVVFYYAKSGGEDPGFYGWAVVLEWYPNSDTPLIFMPTAPSDHLKMDPWWDDNAEKLANKIRGKIAQGTLFEIKSNDYIHELRYGIDAWLACKGRALK